MIKIIYSVITGFFLIIAMVADEIRLSCKGIKMVKYSSQSCCGALNKQLITYIEYDDDTKHPATGRRNLC